MNFKEEGDTASLFEAEPSHEPFEGELVIGPKDAVISSERMSPQEICDAAYPNLPTSEDRMQRFKEEVAIMSEDKPMDNAYSQHLHQLEGAIVCGLDPEGTVAYAILSSDKVSTRRQFKEGDVVAEYWRYLAEINPLFAYKLFLNNIELQGFYQNMLYCISSGAYNLESVKLELESYLRTYSYMEPAVKKLEPLLEEQLKKQQGNPGKNEARMPGVAKRDLITLCEPVTVEGKAEEKKDTEDETEVQEPKDMFRLFACQVPKSAKKQPGWKDTGITIHTIPGSIPVVCIGAEEIAIVTRPSKFHQGIQATFYSVKTRKETRRALVEFHDKMQLKGCMGARFTPEGLAVYLGNTIIMITKEEEIRYLGLQNRLITTITPHGKHQLLVGTDMGECIAIHTKTNEATSSVLQVNATEPVFGIYATDTSDRFILHTCLGVTVFQKTPRGLVRECYEFLRPVSVGTCGSLIVLLNNTAHINVMSMFVSNTVRTFGKPEKYNECPHLQYAYDGVRVFRDKMVFLHQNGLIRVIFTKKA